MNAIYFLPLLLTNNNRNNLEIVAKGKLLPSLKEFSLILGTFSLTVFAWIFFRAENIGHAISYISEILSPSLFLMPEFTGMSRALTTIILVGGCILIEWFGREGDYAIEGIGHKWYPSIRWIFYSLIIFAIGMFTPIVESPFIYFQF